MKKRLIATTAALFAAAMLWSGAHSSATAGNDWEFTGIDSEFTGNEWELTRSSSARGNDWE